MTWPSFAEGPGCDSVRDTALTPGRFGQISGRSRASHRRKAVAVSPILIAILLVVIFVVSIFDPLGQSSLTAGKQSPLAVPAATHSKSIYIPQSTCPNANYYGNSAQLTLAETVNCAAIGGFSGDIEITFVSMAYQESTFCPGAIESGSGACSHIGPGSGPQAEGILQEGTSGQSPPQGGPFPVSGYSPSSCSTWSGSSTDWGGIYFNPTCSFQWALAYYNYNGYAFWGSYLSGDYCHWAPAGFLGTGSVTCSGTNQNQASLPWSTVCPGNVCPSDPTATYSMQDLTTSSPLSCGGTFAAGDTIQFNASASGGTPPYNYSWNFGDGTQGYGSPATHVYMSAGTVTPILTVTDSIGLNSTTGQGCTFTVTPSPRPLISSFSASPTSVTVGSWTNFSVTVTGGTGALHYSYDGLPFGCVSANLTKLACRPTATGAYNVRVYVNDSASHSANSTAPLTVNAPPVTLMSVAVTPTGATMAIWSKQTFTAIPTCSSSCPSGVSYSWALTRTTMGTLNATSGISVILTAGSTAGKVGLFLNASLNGTTQSASPVVIAVFIPPAPTYNVTFTESGLASGVSWSVTFNGSQKSSSTARIAFSIKNGTYGFTVGTVTGYVASPTSGGVQVSGAAVSVPTIKFVVSTSIITSVTVVPTADTVGTGGTTSPFSATPNCSGSCPTGTAFYWNLTNPSMGTLSSNAGTPVTVFAGSTPGTVALFVNASLDGIARQSSPVIITISSTPPPALVSVEVSPASASIGLGGSTSPFTATPGCSATCLPGAAYSWSLSNSSMGALSYIAQNQVTFTAGSKGGTVALFANVTLNGVTEQSAPVLIYVTSSSTPPLTSVSVSPTSDVLSVGGTSAFTAFPKCAGGVCTGEIAYNWVLNNSLGNLSSRTNVQTIFIAGSDAGSVTITVSASLNGVNKQASASISISATAVPILSSVTVNPSSASISVNGTQTLVAIPTCNGGTCLAGLTYSWTITNSLLGTLNATTGPSANFTASTIAGTLVVFVNVTLNGVTKLSPATPITINSPSPGGGSPFLGLPGYDGYILIGGIVAAAVAVIVILVIRHRQMMSPASPPKLTT